MTSNHSDQRGFTLIEILVVIVILSILGGLAAQTLLSVSYKHLTLPTSPHV